ncbi:MAG: flagellar hook-length control protein FliK [Phycisphaerae bacterium]|nr:flagellar hook-length control protein FliK [Phycisphaerae bacterium]
MLRALVASLHQRGGSVNMRLDPPLLGDIRVRLELRDSTVSVRFETANETARQLLEGSSVMLRTTLEARGLSVDRLDFLVARDGAEQTPVGQKSPLETGTEARPGTQGDPNSTPGWGGSGSDGSRSHSGGGPFQHPFARGGERPESVEDGVLTAGDAAGGVRHQLLGAREARQPSGLVGQGVNAIA